MATDLTLRLNNFRGDTVIATALIRNLKHSLPQRTLNVYTEFPELLAGLAEADRVFDAREGELQDYHASLLHYIEMCDPQNSEPHRHLLQHQTEVVQRQLDVPLLETMPRFRPVINLTAEEDRDAKRVSEELAGGRPLIWTQRKTSTAQKDWTPEGWQAVEEAFPDCVFVDLGTPRYTLRQAAAMTKYCHAGVTLDSFLLHGAEAVGATNVLALMMPSRKKVVCYPGQEVLETGQGEITPARVVARIEAMLATTRARAFGPSMVKTLPPDHING